MSLEIVCNCGRRGRPEDSMWRAANEYLPRIGKDISSTPICNPCMSALALKCKGTADPLETLKNLLTPKRLTEAEIEEKLDMARLELFLLEHKEEKLKKRMQTTLAKVRKDFEKNLVRKVKFLSEEELLEEMLLADIHTLEYPI